MSLKKSPTASPERSKQCLSSEAKGVIQEYEGLLKSLKQRSANDQPESRQPVNALFGRLDALGAQLSLMTGKYIPTLEYDDVDFYQALSNLNSNRVLRGDKGHRYTLKCHYINEDTGKLIDLQRVQRSVNIQDFYLAIIEHNLRVYEKFLERVKQHLSK